MSRAEIEARILQELDFFETEAQRQAFVRSRVPILRIVQTWAYDASSHDCFLIARTATQHVVYCATGFGPGFPWSVQAHGATDLGMDGLWTAYLFESVMGSEIWPELPPNFRLCAPGERGSRPDLRR